MPIYKQCGCEKVDFVLVYILYEHTVFAFDAVFYTRWGDDALVALAIFKKYG